MLPERKDAQPLLSYYLALSKNSSFYLLKGSRGRVLCFKHFQENQVVEFPVLVLLQVFLSGEKSGSLWFEIHSSELDASAPEIFYKIS